MQRFVNVHCHLLNFRFIPDAFFKTRAPIRERLLRSKLTGWIARAMTFLWPGKKYDKIHEVLALMKKDIRDVVKPFVDEMDQAGIVLATPLMMDLELASFNVKPESPYRYQVMLISEIAADYPGKIMPFIMFDPRRRSVSELIKTALEEMGFLGVKMYPPLGHHPDPGSFFNDAEVNHALNATYEYCEKESIPITAHCSKGGAYSGDLMHSREVVHKFSHPSSWEGVLEKYPGLRLNFAHFGGNEDFLNIDRSESWSNKILDLMRRYDGVYADISYHEPALWKKTAGDYFATLEKLMNDDSIKDRVLFGTDWLMTRHTWTERAYVEAFLMLAPTMLQQIAFENPRNFLFSDRKLPARIKRFFESKNIKKTDLPPLIKVSLTV